MHKNNLKFNFGYLLESSLGTSSDIEVDFPHLRLDELDFKHIKGRFRATRTGEGIYIGGTFETHVPTECVRCLEPTYVAVEMGVEELFYFPPSIAGEGEYTIGKDGNADLGPLVRELSLLNLPLQPLCRPDCNGLCMACGQNLNERDCGCVDEDLDPRLAVLQKLLHDQDEV